jgi:hypothetical protein
MKYLQWDYTSPLGLEALLEGSMYLWHVTKKGGNKVWFPDDIISMV